MKQQKLIYFLFFLISFSFLHATAPSLNKSDIRKVMAQLFEYHIEKKEMSPVLIERSLKIYVTHFDPGKAYLLSGEALPYVRPSSSLVKSMITEYQKDEFTGYAELDRLITKSIYRARGWRKEWVANPKKMIAGAQAIDIKNLEEKTYVQNEKDLRARHLDQFLLLLSIHLKQYKVADLTPEKEEKLIALCQKQIELSENRYLGIGGDGQLLSAPEKEHQQVLRILKSLAYSLDAHTAYYSPEEAYAMKVELERGMCGIGVLLHESIDGVCISELVKGGPAIESQLVKAGDIITEVDGVSVKGASYSHVLKVLRGEEGSRLLLGVMRKKNEGGEAFHRIELIRKKIVLEDKRVDITYEPYGDGIIGKITLYAFYEGDDGLSSEKDIRAAIKELRKKGPLYGLVLDLRENTGGFLTQSVKVSGLFISSGVVVISKYADGTIKYYRAVDGKAFYDGPLVVLISRTSASATEIVAQTLQDYGVAVIVGDEHSYGKGTIQHQTVTSDRTNSFFKVTIGRYYTVSGKSTQIDGVKSDIVIPTELGFEKIGESYLDFPLAADQVSPAYDDPLTDVDPFAKKWFAKYYLPHLQKPLSFWKERIDILKDNSRQRLEKSSNFQSFLTYLKSRTSLTDKNLYGQEDLQIHESVNILKDMIFLKQKRDLAIGQGV